MSLQGLNLVKSVAHLRALRTCESSVYDYFELNVAYAEAYDLSYDLSGMKPEPENW